MRLYKKNYIPNVSLKLLKNLKYWTWKLKIVILLV